MNLCARKGKHNRKNPTEGRRIQDEENVLKGLKDKLLAGKEKKQKLSRWLAGTETFRKLLSETRGHAVCFHSRGMAVSKRQVDSNTPILSLTGNSVLRSGENMISFYHVR